MQHQKVTSSFSKGLLSDSRYEFGDPNWKRENLSQQIGFVTHFLNRAPQEIKVKINESQLLKFYQENSTKINSTEKKIDREFCGKEPKRKLEIQRTLKLFDKTKKKRKRLKFKELCFPEILSDKFPAKLYKNLQHFIFSIPFLFVFFLYKIPF